MHELDLVKEYFIISNRLITTIALLYCLDCLTIPTSNG